MTDTESTNAAKPHGGFTFALDFGPLLLFFVASKLGSTPSDPTQGAIVGTATFMVAILIATIVSKFKLGRISPMLKLTAALGIFFGALTILFHDESFIMLKPTVVYGFFAVLLLGGWMRGKAMLKYVLELAFEGVDDAGWLKLSRNWGVFFLVLAIANVAMWRMLSFDTWLAIKVWGMMIVLFLFSLANIPMLLKNGLILGEPHEAPPSE